MALRERWKACAVLLLKKIGLVVRSNGSRTLHLPSRITPHSTILPDGTRLSWELFQGDFKTIKLNGDEEFATLSVVFSARGLEGARKILFPLIEMVVDDLCFQVQGPISVVQLELLNVSPPVAVGDEREGLLIPAPNGFREFKMSRSTALDSEITADFPMLRQDYARHEKHIQNALDWYIKGLHASADPDKYILYWIALEILAKASGSKVEAPTTLRCNHVIRTCPECAAPTSVHRQAASMRQFLSAFGVDRTLADRLWEMRQLVHGAWSFDSKQVQGLAELLHHLRSIVMAVLKTTLGMPPDLPPIVTSGGPVISSPALTIRRPLTKSDLSGLAT